MRPEKGWTRSGSISLGDSGGGGGGGVCCGGEKKNIREGELKNTPQMAARLLARILFIHLPHRVEDAASCIITKENRIRS